MAFGLGFVAVVATMLAVWAFVRDGRDVRVVRHRMVLWDQMPAALSNGEFPIQNGAAVAPDGSAIAYVDIAGDQFWHQATPGINGAPDPGDGFGSVLAAGDVTGDGIDPNADTSRDDDDHVEGNGGRYVIYGDAIHEELIPENLDSISNVSAYVLRKQDEGGRQAAS